jgi:hypothetical protein
MQEKQFLVFKKSMRKHIFETSNVFLYKKIQKKNVRVLALCNTQENIFLKKNTSIAIKYKNHNKLINRSHIL